MADELSAELIALVNEYRIQIEHNRDPVATQSAFEKVITHIQAETGLTPERAVDSSQVIPRRFRYSFRTIAQHHKYVMEALNGLAPAKHWGESEFDFQLAELDKLVPEQPRKPPQEEKPHWNPETRTLTFKGRIKKYTQRASVQTRILAAFQEQGWPEAIDDPTPSPVVGGLNDAIYSMNRSIDFLRFSGNGTSERICWEPKPKSRSKKRR
jgi:hypothetical protein